MSNLEDFNEKLKDIQSIPDDEISAPRNMPVDNYQQEAEVLHHWCQQDQKILCANGLDWNIVEEIPVRCGALREAQSIWITTRFSKAETEKEWKDKSPKAYDLRNELIHALRFAYRNYPDLLGRVDEISDGGGHADMIQDLNDLSVLGKNNSEQLEAINLDLSILEQAAQTSDEMANLLGATTVERAECNAAVKLRNQSYTYLKQSVDEVRNFGQYVFWKDEDRYWGYGSDYMRKIRRRQGNKQKPAGVAAE